MILARDDCPKCSPSAMVLLMWTIGRKSMRRSRLLRTVPSARVRQRALARGGEVVEALAVAQVL
ncbi:hypothetical protein [Streptomyces sp. NPDC001404]|uniref:hypothetical protein n=1 Tax=Streptomyces sp. NPDC001404 TaxID=3364571 RepID=UPI0036B48E16